MKISASKQKILIAGLLSVMCAIAVPFTFGENQADSSSSADLNQIINLQGIEPAETIIQRGELIKTDPNNVVDSVMGMLSREGFMAAPEMETTWELDTARPEPIDSQTVIEPSNLTELETMVEDITKNMLGFKEFDKTTMSGPFQGTPSSQNSAPIANWNKIMASLDPVQREALIKQIMASGDDVKDIILRLNPSDEEKESIKESAESNLMETANMSEKLRPFNIKINPPIIRSPTVPTPPKPPSPRRGGRGCDPDP